jgi:hypothetical protein
MLSLHIFLLSFSTVAIIWAFYQTHKVQQQKKLISLISHGVGELMDATQDEILKNKKLIEKAEHTIRPSGSKMDYSDPTNYLDDPGMLATLVAIIVNKYGTLRLGLDDFADMGEEEYVSLYMDMTTHDLILSLKHNLAAEDPFRLISFGSDNDDSTYH